MCHITGNVIHSHDMLNFEMARCCRQANPVTLSAFQHVKVYAQCKKQQQQQTNKQNH